MAYWRFDGWDPHQTAFDKTAFAEVMHGDLGTFLDYLRARAMQEIAGGALRDSLLANKSPEELLKLQNAAKQLPVLWETFRKHGILVGVEVGGDPIAGRLVVVLPQAKHLYPVARLLGEQFDFGTKELQIQGLSVLVGPGDAMGSAGVATWVDGDDLVICFAKETPEQMVKRESSGATQSDSQQTLSASHGL